MLVGDTSFITGKEDFMTLENSQAIPALFHAKARLETCYSFIK